jgi:hypothetical protein
MIRYSERACDTGIESRAPAEEFFEACAATHGGGPWILLVGGSSLADSRVRLAQAAIRLDERPSPWSHVALVLDVDSKDVRASTGAEIRLSPPSTTGPERSYVSFFRLGDYADDAAFPNLGVVSVEVRTGSGLGARVRERALRRNPAYDDRPVGAVLSAWNAYLFDPTRRTNPLLENVPHPGAAYLDFVFAGSGLDLTPAARSPAVSPEHLWATLRYFEHPTVKTHFSTRRLRSSPDTEALFTNDLAGAYHAFRSTKAAP